MSTGLNRTMSQYLNKHKQITSLPQQLTTQHNSSDKEIINFYVKITLDFKIKTTTKQATQK